MSRKRKLRRSEFQLKSWIKSNLKAFSEECPENSNFHECHKWWKQRADSTLEPELASEVADLLGAGVAVGEAVNDSQLSKVFIELGSSMLDIKL